MTLQTLNTRDPEDTIRDDTETALKCITHRWRKNFKKCRRRLRMAGRRDIVHCLNSLGWDATMR